MENEYFLGIYEKAFPKQYHWERRFKTARDIGFDFIEFSIDESDERLARLDWDATTCQDFLAIKNTYDVCVPTMCLSGLRKFPLGASDPSIRSMGLDTLLTAIRLASRLGLSVVQVAGYDVYNEESTETTRENFKHHIEIALTEAQKLKIVLAIENMETRATDSLTKVMEYINYFDSPFLQIYVDIGNLIAMGNDLASQLRIAQGHIAAFHIKDVMPKICRDIPFGQGIVDFDQVFAEIKHIGFKGLLLLEMWANSHSDPIEEMAKAYSFITSKIQLARP